LLKGGGEVYRIIGSTILDYIFSKPE